MARLRHSVPAAVALALAFGACADETTSPSALDRLEGTWVQVSTDHPGLRAPGATQCFVFRADSTYLLDEVTPKVSGTAVVPASLHRWQGQITLRGDTLSRSMAMDDLYTGFDGDSLIPYWSYDSPNSFTATPVRLRHSSLVTTLNTWVQDSGYVSIIDSFRRGTATECGQHFPGLIR
jgi:hypothetical protein